MDCIFEARGTRHMPVERDSPIDLHAKSCVFISAGEFSGDLLGAKLAQELRAKDNGLKLFGITGPHMVDAGVTSICSSDELNVMGLLEVAKKVCDIKEIQTRILAWIDRYQPSCAVLIDFPDFHLRLAELLKQRQIPVIQYVAPKAWAWGQWRVPKIRSRMDLVLGILPFEESFFRSRGVAYHFVGSPHYDRLKKISVKKRHFGISDGSSVIAYLPGSRVSEFQRIFPLLKGIRDKVAEVRPQVVNVIPLAPSIDISTLAGILGEPLSKIESQSFDSHGFTFYRNMSLELMTLADAAVVASGTATLECALAGAPQIVVYRMSPLTFKIAMRLVKLKWVSLVNLLMDERIVEEYLQELDRDVIAMKLLKLVDDTPERRAMKINYERLAMCLQERPEKSAVDWILEVCHHRNKAFFP
jgi:lipid-A-disaccharide synthase